MDVRALRGLVNVIASSGSTGEERPRAFPHQVQVPPVLVSPCLQQGTGLPQAAPSEHSLV